MLHIFTFCIFLYSLSYLLQYFPFEFYIYSIFSILFYILSYIFCILCSIISIMCPIIRKQDISAKLRQTAHDVELPDVASNICNILTILLYQWCNILTILATLAISTISTILPFWSFWLFLQWFSGKHWAKTFNFFYTIFTILPFYYFTIFTILPFWVFLGSAVIHYLVLVPVNFGNA